MLQRGHSGDGCDLASTLCNYDLRKGDLFVLSESCKYLFRAVNVWCRCAQYFVFVARCVETIEVCIWCMFFLMYVVVTVRGLWERLLCNGRCYI